MHSILFFTCILIRTAPHLLTSQLYILRLKTAAINRRSISSLCECPLCYYVERRRWDVVNFVVHVTVCSDHVLGLWLATFAAPSDSRAFYFSFYWAINWLCSCVCFNDSCIHHCMPAMTQGRCTIYNQPVATRILAYPVITASRSDVGFYLTYHEFCQGA